MACLKFLAQKEKSHNPFPWRVLITSIFVCAGGSFHYGYQLTVINPTESIFRQFINETCSSHFGRYMTETVYRLVWSVILNLLVIGAAFGTLPLVRLSENLGRRRTFYVSSGFTLFGLSLQAFSKLAFSFELFSIGRLLTGFGSGLALALEPMYLNEISPVERRGFFCSMTGILVELGFIVGGVVALPAVLGTDSSWPYMFAVEIVPILTLCLALPFIHESPRYLLARGKKDECRRSLIYFGHKDVDGSMREIESEIRCQKERVTLREIWEKVYLRRAAYLGTLVSLTAAMSGIIAIDFFSTSIFVDVGLTPEAAQYASVAIFVQCFVSAILGSFIIDKVGRRFLLLVTTIALILIDMLLMFLTIAYNLYGVKWAGYMSVAACIMFSFTFGVGPSVLQWTVAAEMVPQNARSAVQSVAMTVQKVAAIVVGVAFYPLQGAIGAYSFLLFIMPLVIFFLVFVWRFPETKNKTVVEILESLGYTDANDDDGGGGGGAQSGKKEKISMSSPDIVLKAA